MPFLAHFPGAREDDCFAVGRPRREGLHVLLGGCARQRLVGKRLGIDYDDIGLSHEKFLRLKRYKRFGIYLFTGAGGDLGAHRVP